MVAAADPDVIGEAGPDHPAGLEARDGLQGFPISTTDRIDIMP
jgi:hypothetical protein